ncbi:MAG: hypothetical protein AB1390_00320 [Nitrospirota bacterium]
MMAYWNYKIKKEFDKAYEYEYPVAKRSLTTYIAKHANPMLEYKSFELKSMVKKADHLADVELTVVPVVKVPGMRAFERTITIKERWVKVDEVWYHMEASSSSFTHREQREVMLRTKKRVTI